MAKAPSLMASHSVIRTADLDDARDQVARVFCSHRLTLLAGPGRLDLTLNRYQPGSIGLNYVDYGAGVRIQPGELGSFHLVQIPLQGVARVRCGAAQVDSTPTLAAVPNATEDVDMLWQEGTPQLVVYLPRTKVEEAVESLTGRRHRAPVRFSLGMDMTTAPARAWRALVDGLLVDAQAAGPVLHRDARAQLEDLIVLTLVGGHASNYTDQIHCGAELPAPRAIRRAMELCDHAQDEPLTVSMMARSVGVSVRSLQDGFRRYVGMSPAHYLREVRLRSVHRDLSDPEAPPSTVAEVAHRWGFTHLGRFAAAYHHRYGERPSDTLRAASGGHAMDRTA